MSKSFWILIVVPLIAAAGANAATLRPQSTIKADVIRVGDLFGGAGEAAKVVVGRAPAPVASTPPGPPARPSTAACRAWVFDSASKSR